MCTCACAHVYKVHETLNAHLGQGRGVVEIMVGEGLLDGLSGGLGAVVRDSAVDVVNNVRRADAVVQEVEDLAVRAVDRHECALYMHMNG